MTAPLAVTCGDPAGIGPEIAAKAWATLGASLPFVWIGDPSHLPDGTPLAIVDDPSEAVNAASDGLPVLSTEFPVPVQPGRPDPRNAESVVSAIRAGVDLVMGGRATGLVTGPISKAVLQDGAAFPYPGHTEFLAALAGVDEVVMMLACPALRVVPATIHIPISDVPRTLTAGKLTRVLRLTHEALRRDFGCHAPRIAVAGLNPHAGESGKMGREEIDLIIPVIETLRAEGLDIAGPLPADTMFHARARARYDAAVAMYHDQALIPIKTIDFDGGVNTTLGLPFVRTSPDHGTAFDIAGRGTANPASMIAALRLAHQMARTRGATGT